MAGDAVSVFGRETEPAAAQPGDPCGLFEKALGGDAADADEYAGGDEGAMCRSTKGRHRAISSVDGERFPGGAPEQHVGDARRVPVASDRREHEVEQASRRADEGQPATVLLRPWRFADEHQVGVRGAVGEYGVAGGALERAAVEGRHRLGEGGDVGGRGGGGARLLDQRLGGNQGGVGGAPGRRRERRLRGGRRGSPGRRETVARSVVDGFVGAHRDKPAQRRGVFVRRRTRRGHARVRFRCAARKAVCRSRP